MRELFQSPPQRKVDPAIPQDRPVYRVLTEKGFFGPDDTLHAEGEIIVLYDEPNEDMEPLNDLARKAFDSMLDRLEESARKVAESNGRYFAGRPRTKEEMLENASADARRVQSLNNPKGVPIMGARKDSSTRIQQVGVEVVPDMGAQEQNKRRQKIETIGA